MSMGLAIFPSSEKIAQHLNNDQHFKCASKFKSDGVFRDLDFITKISQFFENQELNFPRQVKAGIILIRDKTPSSTHLQDDDIREIVLSLGRLVTGRSNPDITASYPDPDNTAA